MTSASPVTVDLVAEPRRFMREFLDISQDHATLSKMFMESLDKWKQSNGEDIPILASSHQLDSIKDGQLIKFRCMIQDNSCEPELCYSSLKFTHSKTGETKIMHTRFMEELDTPDSTEWILDQSSLTFTDVDSVVGVTIPCQTTWTRLAATNNTPMKAASWKEDQRIKEKLHSSNPDAMAVLIKFHDLTKRTKLPLNALIEVTGIYSKPADTEPEHNQDIFGPSWSVLPIPSIQSISYTRIPETELHSFESASIGNLSDELSTLSLDIAQHYKQGIEYIRNLVFGDALLAEYILLHLISKIRLRHQGNPAGFFPLNIYGTATDATGNDSLSKNIFDGISEIIPRCHFLPLTPKHLASARFAPGLFVFEDSTPEPLGLVTGELQLPDGTFVVIDETLMEVGELKGQAVINLQHLHSLLTDATLPFAVGVGASHYVGSLPVDLGLIVISSGKSMFPIECKIPLRPEPGFVSTTTAVESIQALRTLLHSVRSDKDYKLPSDMETMVQQSFIKARQMPADSLGQGHRYTEDMLQLRLEVARNLSLLHGLTELTSSMWERACVLESARLARLSLTPSRVER